MPSHVVLRTPRELEVDAEGGGCNSVPPDNTVMYCMPGEEATNGPRRGVTVWARYESAHRTAGRLAFDANSCREDAIRPSETKRCGTSRGWLEPDAEWVNRRRNRINPHDYPGKIHRRIVLGRPSPGLLVDNEGER